MKLNAQDIEIALARHFNHRTNIIVPNVAWGLNLSYECDMLVVSPAGYAHEIEIKTTSGDIKAESRKRGTAHQSRKIHRFSYAVPNYLKDCEHLRLECGLIVVNKDLRCQTIRPPRLNKAARKLTEKEINKLLHLGCMRIYSLKEKLYSLQHKLYNLKRTK